MSRSLQRPTGDQARAADPGLSPWVGANAGSGKTRVLTQRVARLLLAGADPQKILCLTYTKAAAAEMQNRLFAMLGDWAMAPNDWLARQLALLEGRDGSVPHDRLPAARRLFARALETPGGIRIQTIHAFCDALIRRFPLEAGVSPRFQVLDDRQAQAMQDRIRAELATRAEAGEDPAFDGIATRLSDTQIDALIAAIQARRAGFGPDLETALEAHYRADAGRAPVEVARDALAALDAPRLRALAAAMERDGGRNDQPVAKALGAALGMAGEDPLAAAETLVRALHTGDGTTPRKTGKLPVKAVCAAMPEAKALCEELVDWAVRTRLRLVALRCIERARALHAFATALLARYEDAKRSRALLDFDDLVDRAHHLLVGSAMGPWVLWKLDRGIDHILVDEAQDTAPRQWALIEAIAAEFRAGEGARDQVRTLFVVGDEKQSIYSFQGAEPGAFGATRERLRRWLEQMGQRLERPALTTSFRSAPGILHFVDTVFAGDAAAGLSTDGGPILHQAHRTDDSARVDLWPLVEPEAAVGDEDWWLPVDRPPPGDPKERLARTLAGEIARMVAEDRLPPRAGRPGRRVRPGDILILVARRDALMIALIRHLKNLRVPVAGADRLRLGAELAVRDLMALVKVAATPADDLSLAAVLRSPLCGLSEEALFALAHGRPGTLLSRLKERGEAHPEAAELVLDMIARADFLRPYEFLERVLVRHDGRRRLIARLGLEAEDPIDELLAQALAFEARETPSLAGFVDWIERGDIEVKREAEGACDMVRVMTVHGAKGLEAPIVILPDTMGAPNRGDATALHAIGEGDTRLVLWQRSKAKDDVLTHAARADADRRQDEERNRLLYVALTRAEDWLILCGAGDPKRAPALWYGALADAMDRLGEAVTTVPGPVEFAGGIRRFEHRPVPLADTPPPEEAAAAVEPRPDPPAWLHPARAEPRPRRHAPSELLPHAPAAPVQRDLFEPPADRPASRDEAMLRGSAVHRLLELIADRPAALRPTLAARLIEAEFPDLPDPDDAVAEALAVLDDPALAPLFGPDSLTEAGIALPSPDGGPAMIGRIDRLVVTPRQVRVIDFKTDAAPPRRPDDAPAAYRAQLAAYRAGIAALYPRRRVEAAILWTRTRRLMVLPEAVLVEAETAVRLRLGALELDGAGP